MSIAISGHHHIGHGWLKMCNFCPRYMVGGTISLKISILEGKHFNLREEPSLVSNAAVISGVLQDNHS